MIGDVDILGLSQTKLLTGENRMKPYPSCFEMAVKWLEASVPA